MSVRLPEEFFRHEYGRMVASLTRRVGMRHLELAEDAAQAALLSALETWAGLTPKNPSAWLFTAAKNHLFGELRQKARRERLLEAHVSSEVHDEQHSAAGALCADVEDDLLRMLFACCDDAIPVESQMVIALKTLCGFDVREIGQRLFMSEANVYKRLQRARQRLQELPFEPKDLSKEQLRLRLSAVRSILYLLFTEGYLSSHVEGAVRRELCDEAKRLTSVLCEHPVTKEPETFALLSLMHLHAARMPARLDFQGGLLLLEEQDRSLWDTSEIQLGLEWLARSADGDRFTRYHAEAGIAAEHCLAPSFSATNWEKVVQCYELLEESAPSILHSLNRALATAEWKGPHQGLAVIESLHPPAWLEGSYMWTAVLADLSWRCGNDEVARGYRESALRAAPSTLVRDALTRRLHTKRKPL